MSATTASYPGVAGSGRWERGPEDRLTQGVDHDEVAGAREVTEEPVPRVLPRPRRPEATHLEATARRGDQERHVGLAGLRQAADHNEGEVASLVAVVQDRPAAGIASRRGQRRGEHRGAAADALEDPLDPIRGG